MKIRKLDTLEIATADLHSSAAVHRHNFGLSAVPSGAGLALAIGGSTIRLTPSPALANDEMAALWLEADDVDEVAGKLAQAGVPHPPIRREEGRRILAVEGPATNFVPLFIFDRRS